MLIRKLLQCGAKTNVLSPGKQQCSALGWAAGRGHTDVVKLLLEHGADRDCGDKYGTSPLIWAVRGGHLEIVVQVYKVRKMNPFLFSSLFSY